MNGDVNAIGGGDYGWVTFWMKWPAGHFAPQYAGSPEPGSRLEPSDETLVRSISAFEALATFNAGTFTAQTWEVCIGLIAWDGGEFPAFFDLATFTSTTSVVAPPNPIVDADDDWILRNSYGCSRTNPTILSDSTDSFVNSRAKRKLPPDTGILAVIAVANTLLGDSQTNMQLDWNWDVRMALRSGYTA